MSNWWNDDGSKKGGLSLWNKVLQLNMRLLGKAHQLFSIDLLFLKSPIKQYQ
jgi:hypothetical protein